MEIKLESMMALRSGKNQRVPWFARRFPSIFAVLMLALAGLVSIPCLGSTVVAWGTGTMDVTNSADGVFGQSIIPAHLTNAVMIASGYSKSFALKSDGTILGWGDDILAGLGFYN